MQKSYDSASLLEKSIGKLRQHHARLNKKTLRNLPDNEPVVSICFDDVPSNKGAKILQQAGVLGTFYTCFGLLEDKSPVQALHADGHEIGCHTYSHVNASFNTPELFERACNDNRSAAETLAIRPQQFAFPEGGMSLAAKRYVTQHYQSARSGFLGINKRDIDVFCLRSNPAYTHTLQHIHGLISDIQDSGGWLILYTHDVAHAPSEHGITPRDLQYLLTTLRTKNIAIKPVGEVVQSLC